MNRLYLSVALAIILCSYLTYGQTPAPSGVCTGYPKMYNGKPCASTTRYWDGQMGACGCGTGDQNPFSWQWTKGTAAASAPIFGAGTWCGSGCGKCFKLTPTAVGASPLGRGAPDLTSLVVKVTNLCPYAGNEAWCAYDVNSHGYEAHFDLMDYNMAGIISNLGWDNPEVTYEEVDCAANGYGDWSCQCKDNAGTVATEAPATEAPATEAPATEAPATEAPTEAPTQAPTPAHTKKPTKAPTAAPTTEAPATEAPVTEAPVTEAPVTEAPTDAPTEAPATEAPVTEAPTDAPTDAPTEAPATEAPVTEAPVTEEPTDAPTDAPTEAPVTEAPVTEAPVTEEPVTEAPTEAPVTEAPTEAPTDAPATHKPHKPSSSPSKAATSAPTSAPAIDAATTAPEASGIKIQINGGSNAWWLGFTVIGDTSDIAKVEIMDNSRALPTWTMMTYEGNQYWNMFSINPNGQMKAPLSLRLTSADGHVVVANNIITTFQAATIETGVAL